MLVNGTLLNWDISQKEIEKKNERAKLVQHSLEFHQTERDQLTLGFCVFERWIDIIFERMMQTTSVQLIRWIAKRMDEFIKHIYIEWILKYDDISKCVFIYAFEWMYSIHKVAF